MALTKIPRPRVSWVAMGVTMCHYNPVKSRPRRIHPAPTGRIYRKSKNVHSHYHAPE